MPPSLAGDDQYPISIWAPSTTASELGVDLEAGRDDVVARLVERIEILERRIADGTETEEGLEIGRSSEKEMRGGSGEHWSRMDYCGLVGAVLFVMWICGIVTLAVAARYRAAGNKD